jgi:hypothetical protein
MGSLNINFRSKEHGKTGCLFALLSRDAEVSSGTEAITPAPLWFMKVRGKGNHLRLGDAMLLSAT